jgi:hypothetical protein
VKKTIVTLACALIAPLGFAQTGTTTTKQTTTGTQPTTTTETTTTYAAGTVSTYTPGKTIVVQSNLGPVSFVLGTTTRIVDGAGHTSHQRSDRVSVCAFITRARATLGPWNA